MAKIPVLKLGNRSIQRTLLRSYDDLGALRIEDPEHPDRNVVAAGAPWFMALFGRDSLWASIMALPVDPSLAPGTIQTLAERQGRVVNTMTEEKPGKILHEVRLNGSSGLALGGKSAYYGSVDATPLFVSLLGEINRWGVARDTVAALLPHADRALDWIRDCGDKDGDGFIEYERLNEHGLINQGWKDSWDGINFADGKMAEPPMALCEVQAYVYSAYLTRAFLAYDAGDRNRGDEYATQATDLINNSTSGSGFQIADTTQSGWTARSSRSMLAPPTWGICLLFGLVDEDKAPLVAERLMSPEMFSGWAVRTLANDMGAYNPASHHNGSVWPHDNAIIVGGLLRYGFVEQAQQMSTALLEATDYSAGRLPELFGGFSREHFDEPVPYPTACSPQAWAATTPIQLLKSLMGYQADVALGKLWIDPVLPESYGDLHITNAPLGGGRVTIDISGSTGTIKGLPDRIVLQYGSRPWPADLVKQSNRHPRLG